MKDTCRCAVDNVGTTCSYEGDEQLLMLSRLSGR